MATVPLAWWRHSSRHTHVAGEVMTVVDAAVRHDAALHADRAEARIAHVAADLHGAREFDRRIDRHAGLAEGFVGDGGILGAEHRGR